MSFVELFPTPRKLAEKLLDGIDFDAINTVLEPSAGKGDLAEVVAGRIQHAGRGYRTVDDFGKRAIDCIEIEPDLRAALKGKGFRVVHDDFLTYNTAKTYDLICSNLPFDDGDRHLLKMLELARYGRKHYVDMTVEERTVVDSFEGAESYARVVAEPESFLLDTGRLLALPQHTEEAA